MAFSRFCILFSDTGGGHRSAAEAVEAALRELIAGRHGPSPEIVMENAAERSHPLNRAFVDLYNFLLRHNQAAMKYYHWFIEKFKPNDSELGYWLARDYTFELIDRIEPAVVVSVHPMVNHYLARAIREKGAGDRIRLIVVLTDPNANLWSGWGCPDADLIIAPNDLAKGCLLSWGIAPEKILVAGMPVHPRYLRPPAVGRGEYLLNLGLADNRLTVCITAGWAGAGKLVAVYRELTRVQRPVQVIFVCGHNADLYKDMQREAGASSVPTAVLPFNGDMSDLMNASDLLVTKAGGLTTFEAIARRLPMAIDLLTEAMPQEAGTAEMLIAEGLAVPLYRPEEIVAVVESLDPLRRGEKPLPTAHSLDRTDAVFQIAEIALEALSPAWSAASTARRRQANPAQGSASVGQVREMPGLA